MVWGWLFVLSTCSFLVDDLSPLGRCCRFATSAENAPNVRYNVITGFQNPAVSGFYIFAMILLCMHLYHGLWSMFQSLGISHPRYTPKLKKGAAIFAILIAIGNISIPIAVMAGLLTL